MLTDLLPYLEYSTVYNNYNKSINWNQGSNVALSQTRIPTFICPSNPEGGVLDTAPPGSNPAFVPGIAATTDYSPIFRDRARRFHTTLGAQRSSGNLQGSG